MLAVRAAQHKRISLERIPAMSNLANETALRIREKFDFYLVALAFTVLALAVQTGNASTNSLATAAELLGRLSLLVSGLAGLYRLEGLPMHYIAEAAIAHDTKALRDTEGMLVRGQQTALDPDTHQPKNLSEHKVDVLAHRAGLTSALEKRRLETTRSYQVHKWTLVAGLALLTFGRSWADVRWLFARLVGWL